MPATPASVRVTADATTVARHLTARLTGAHLVLSQCREPAPTTIAPRNPCERGDPGPGGSPHQLPRSQGPAGCPRRRLREPEGGLGQAVMVSVWCPAVVDTVTSVPRLVWRI